MLLKDKYNTCGCRTSENCKSLVLQDKCNIEIFLSPDKVPKSISRQKEQTTKVVTGVKGLLFI